MSLCETRKPYKVCLTTLPRHQKSFKESGSKKYSYSINYDLKRVFTLIEEAILVNYITTATKMRYGLTKTGV